MQAMESAFDVCTEDLFNQTVKLEEMEKKAGNAEGEVSSLRSRLILLQENNEKQEERLAKATLELAGACQRADSNVRKRTELENAVSSNEETIDNLDKQLSESKITLTDSENKFEDISRKLATLEADAARGNERAEGAEKKIKDIEEELRLVGANMQQLEIGEEKTIAREEASQNEILELLYKLKMSDYRGENAEMNIQRLNVRIDQVEEDLLGEKYKIKKGERRSKPDFRGYDQHGMLNENILKTGTRHFIMTCNIYDLMTFNSTRKLYLDIMMCKTLARMMKVLEKKLPSKMKL